MVLDYRRLLILFFNRLAVDVEQLVKRLVAGVIFAF